MYFTFVDRLAGSIPKGQMETHRAVSRDMDAQSERPEVERLRFTLIKTLPRKAQEPSQRLPSLSVEG